MINRSKRLVVKELKELIIIGLCEYNLCSSNLLYERQWQSFNDKQLLDMHAVQSESLRVTHDTQ